MSLDGLKSEERAERKTSNRLLLKLGSLLGLTTGIGVIAWGVWSMVTTVGTFVYEETGVSTDEILMNTGLNDGLLLSAIVVALGVIILELKKIQYLIIEAQADDELS